MTPEHPHKAEIDMLREQVARDRAEIAAWRDFIQAHAKNDYLARWTWPINEYDWGIVCRHREKEAGLRDVARSLAGPEIPPDPRDATIAELKETVADLEASIKGQKDGERTLIGIVKSRDAAIADLEIHASVAIADRDASIARLEAKLAKYRKFADRFGVFMDIDRPQTPMEAGMAMNEICRLRAEAMAD